MKLALRARALGFAALVFCDSACEPHDPALEATSKAIQDSASECMATVRDRHVKYEEVSSCNALGPLATRYLEAGGDKEKTPPKYDLRYMSAQRMAWTALAMSESCSGKPLRIW